MRTMAAAAFIGTLLLVPADITLAQTRTLVRPDGAGGSIIIWKNEKAHSEGVKLIGAGINKTNPALLMPLLACLVPVGAQAVVTDGGFFSSNVTIVSGNEAGCRGVISNDYLGKK
jgi:hypothetical protein